MNCSKCGAKLATDAVFCTNCGMKVEQPKKVCPNCGAGMKEDALFCELCGTEYAYVKAKRPQNPAKTTIRIQQAASKEIPKWRRKIKKHRLAIVVATIIIIVFCLCSTYVFFARSSKSIEDPNYYIITYLKATVVHDKDAMNRLGICYSRGLGVKKSEKNAFKWFKKSAEAGDALGMCNLAGMYHKGNGVAQDRQQAIYWYRRAADTGDSVAKVISKEALKNLEE